MHTKAKIPPPTPPLEKGGVLRSTARQVWEIKELWGRVARAADKDQSLRNFLGRMRLPQNPEWLTLTQAQRIIEALKAMAQRQSVAQV